MTNVTPVAAAQSCPPGILKSPPSSRLSTGTGVKDAAVVVEVEEGVGMRCTVFLLEVW